MGSLFNFYNDPVTGKFVSTIMNEIQISQQTFYKDYVDDIIDMSTGDLWVDTSIADNHMFRYIKSYSGTFSGYHYTSGSWSSYGEHTVANKPVWIDIDDIKIYQYKNHVTVSTDEKTGQYTSISSAVSALSSTGGTVFIKNGTYLEDENIDCSDKNWTFIGESYGKVIIDSTNTDADSDHDAVFRFYNNGSRIFFKNIIFDLSTYDTSYRTNIIHIYGDEGSGWRSDSEIEFTIEDCKFTGSYYLYSIWSESEGTISLNRVYIKKYFNISAGGSTGIPDDDSKLSINNCKISNGLRLNYNYLLFNNNKSIGSVDPWLYFGNTVAVINNELQTSSTSRQTAFIHVQAKKSIITNNIVTGVSLIVNYMPIAIFVESPSGFLSSIVNDNTINITYTYLDYTMNTALTYHELQYADTDHKGVFGIAVAYRVSSLKNVSVNNNNITITCTDSGTDPTNWPKNTGILLDDISYSVCKNNVITLNSNAKDRGIVLYNSSNNLLEGNRVINYGSGQDYIEDSCSGNSDSQGVAFPSGNL